MNKKLICLLLSLLMLLTCVLASCSGKKDDEEEGSGEDTSARTLTMWLIAEDPVVERKSGETEEQAIARAKEEQKKAQDAVQAKFSAMTKAKFHTDVVLRFCTEAEYYAKLESAIAENQKVQELEAAYSKALRTYKAAQKKTEEGKKKDDKTLTQEFHALPENEIYKHLNPYDPNNNISPDGEEGAVESDVYTENKYGVQEVLYPAAGEDQVDIFYIGDTLDATGYEKYMEYVDSGWLASLNEELSTSSKKLESYISTSLLKGVEVDGVKYAIPNNVAIGEYTYMFIDKEIFDEYYHKIDSVSGLTDLDLFLNDVMYENTGKGTADEDYIVPIASTFEECINMQTWYWNIAYTDRSVYDTYYDEATGRNYVVRYAYEVEGVNKLTDWVIEDVLYKVDDKGNFLDAYGNVLPYTYAEESGFYWTFDERDNPVKVSDAASRSLYLVDEGGNAITPENDKRVKVEADTNGDQYGNVRPTYFYYIDKHEGTVDEGDFSILGAVIQDPANFNRGSVNLEFSSLFTNAEYRDLYATLKDYEYRGYYGQPVGEQKAAVSFVKGDAKILEDYKAVMKQVAEGDSTAEYIYNGRTYHVLVAEYPQATEKELYGNMFAVYESSDYVSRAMKVLTYLNTNSEMRDLLQYGVEGYHYERTDEGAVRLLSGDPEYGTYRMKLERTGNCFVATPEEHMSVGFGSEAWYYAKIQNNQSLIHPLLGFDFNTATADSDYSLDVELLSHINRLNEEATERINECRDKEELLLLMTSEDTGFMYIYAPAQDKVIDKADNWAYDPSAQTDSTGSSPYTVYYEWMTEYKYLPANRVTD